MTSFLEKVADELIDIAPASLLIIFPTRRACQEFRATYARKKGGVSRLPVILPVSDLPDHLETTVVADEITLLLHLKEIYDRLYGAETFESFLPFGRQLLDDFNEIDRQQVDATQLFEEVKDFKALEERFGPGAEESDYLRNFWQEFLQTPYTPLQDAFLAYWKQLPELYRQLKQALNEAGIAYEGMVWRSLVENMPQQRFFEKFDTIAFAGFYALNKTEEGLFAWLEKAGKLKLFVDGDQLYVNHPHHEAGLFLRKGYLAGSEKWIENLFSTPKDSYVVRGCNGRFSVARELAIRLADEWEAEARTGNKKSRMVVLADEGLLYPLLHHCDRLNVPVNPSMGFPLKHHPVYKLLQQFRALRKFKAEDLTATVQQRFLDDFLSDPLMATMNIGNSILPLQEAPAPLAQLMQYSGDDLSEEIPLLLAFMEAIQFKEEWMQEIHLQAVRVIKTGIRLLEPHQERLPLASWWQLLLEYFGEQRIPFLSDRTNGIPVVGFLESRILDFEVVHIAPLNEGILPSKAVSRSCIPYSLRKAYHLPCKEEQDAVTAYHFYRLLQRAKDIRLYYNTQLDAMGGGEKSRYLYQLQQEVVQPFPPAYCEYAVQESVVAPPSVAPIEIPKTDAVLQKIRERFSGTGENGAPKGFSASALNTYLACSLRFYFDQVAGIRPENEPEGLVAGTFGNVLHRCMELLYSGHKMITPAVIDTALTAHTQLLQTAISEAYGKPVDTGHDYLMAGVLEELIERILRFDNTQLPIELIGLEEALQVDFSIPEAGAFGIKGIIDRLDIHEGTLRILDYKTGQESIQKDNDPENIFGHPDYKLNFQLMLYCLLVHEYYPDMHLPIKAGIFRMRQFDEGIDWLNAGGVITPEEIEVFKTRLFELIREIMQPEIPFRQTTDTARCRFCDYKQLCRRTS